MQMIPILRAAPSPSPRHRVKCKGLNNENNIKHPWQWLLYDLVFRNKTFVLGRILQHAGTLLVEVALSEKNTGVSKPRCSKY